MARVGARACLHEAWLGLGLGLGLGRAFMEQVDAEAVGEHVAVEQAQPHVKPGSRARGLRLGPAGAPEAAPGARARLGLPQAPASLGHSAASGGCVRPCDRACSRHGSLTSHNGGDGADTERKRRNVEHLLRLGARF